MTCILLQFYTKICIISNIHEDVDVFNIKSFVFHVKHMFFFFNLANYIVEQTVYICSFRLENTNNKINVHLKELCYTYEYPLTHTKYFLTKIILSWIYLACTTMDTLNFDCIFELDTLYQFHSAKFLQKMACLL